MNPKVWKNPEIFQPERFEEANIKNMKNFRCSFLPFSIGNRDCIGKYFALTEAKLILTKMILNFKFEFKNGFKESDLVVDLNTISKPKELPLKLINRN